MLGLPVSRIPSAAAIIAPRSEITGAHPGKVSCNRILRGSSEPCPCGCRCGEATSITATDVARITQWMLDVYTHRTGFCARCDLIGRRRLSRRSAMTSPTGSVAGGRRTSGGARRWRRWGPLRGFIGHASIIATERGTISEGKRCRQPLSWPEAKRFAVFQRLLVCTDLGRASPSRYCYLAEKAAWHELSFCTGDTICTALTSALCWLIFAAAFVPVLAQRGEEGGKSLQGSWTAIKAERDGKTR